MTGLLIILALISGMVLLCKDPDLFIGIVGWLLSLWLVGYVITLGSKAAGA